MALASSPEAFAGQLIESSAGMFRMLSIHVGAKLGYYEILAGVSGLTAPDLAKRAGTDPRYAREWLEQQVVAGVLDVEDPNAAPDSRVFVLPAAHREVPAGSVSSRVVDMLGVRTIPGQHDATTRREARRRDG